MRRRRSFLLAFALVLLLLAALRFARAQTDAATCPPGFAGLLPPRLLAGEDARVVAGGVPNRVRETPGTAGRQIGQIAPETVVAVVNGPACADGIVWWAVQVPGGIMGWTAEGLLDSGYFLEPVTDTGIARGQTAVAQATVNAAQVMLTAQAALTATANNNATVIAHLTERAALDRTQIAATSAAYTATAQFFITPSATPTITLTPTVTPTLRPLEPLPAERETIGAGDISRLSVLAELEGGAWRVTFAPDSSQVLINDTVYDLPSMRRAEKFGEFPIELGRIFAISPDLRYVAYSPSRGVLRVYDTESSVSSDVPIPYDGEIIISGPPNYVLATAVGEGYGNPEPPQLYLYDIQNQRLIRQMDNPAAFTARIAFNRDSTRVASTGTDIRLIEVRANRWIIPTSGSSSGGIAYRPVPDGQPEQLAFGAGTGVVLFDLARGTRREFAITAASTGWQIGFSPDGQLMGVVGTVVHGDFYAAEPRFNLFDVETGEVLLDTGDTNAFAFSPDGTLLVVSGATTRILGIPR